MHNIENSKGNEPSSRILHDKKIDWHQLLKSPNLGRGFLEFGYGGMDTMILLCPLYPREQNIVFQTTNIVNLDHQ